MGEKKTSPIILRSWPLIKIAHFNWALVCLVMVVGGLSVGGSTDLFSPNILTMTLFENLCTCLALCMTTLF